MQGHDQSASGHTALTGGCLCGAVRYRLNGPVRPVVACHCVQCRRSSGLYAAATRSRLSDFGLETRDSLCWYESSPGIHRGFCGTCGSSLFWQRSTDDAISVQAGTLDSPTGLQLVQQIYTAYAGDYYRIDPALPQSAERGEIAPIPDRPSPDSTEAS